MSRIKSQNVFSKKLEKTCITTKTKAITFVYRKTRTFDPSRRKFTEKRLFQPNGHFPTEDIEWIFPGSVSEFRSDN